MKLFGKNLGSLVIAGTVFAFITLVSGYMLDIGGGVKTTAFLGSVLLANGLAYAILKILP